MDGHVLSVVMALSLRVRKAAASGLQMQSEEAVVVSCGTAKTATLTIPRCMTEYEKNWIATCVGMTRMARTRQTVAAAWVLTATTPGSTSLTSVSVTFAPTSTSLEMRASRLLPRQVRTWGADAGEY